MPRTIDQQIAEAQAKLNRLKTRQKASDTRRKIILGGLLLDAAAKDERYAKVVGALMARIDRDNDRKAFQGWTPPVAPEAGSPGLAPAAAPNGSTGTTAQP